MSFFRFEIKPLGDFALNVVFGSLTKAFPDNPRGFASRNGPTKRAPVIPEAGPGMVTDIGIIISLRINHLALSVYYTDARVDANKGQAAIAATTSVVHRYCIAQ